MEEIISLTKVINKNKVKQVEIVGIPAQGPSSMINDFYEKISNDKFEDEISAAEYFFKNSPYKDKYFNRLKNQLKSRLINSVFFIDLNQPEFNEMQKAYYNCYKMAAATKILLGRHARQAAIPIAEKAIRQAMKFNFTELVLSLSRSLRVHYGSIIGDKKKFSKYNLIVNEYTEIYQAELKAEEYYTELALIFASTNATKPELLEQAKTYCKELKNIGKNVFSFRFKQLEFSIINYRYEIENDYQKVTENCKRALVFFDTQEQVVSAQVKIVFLLKMLTGQMQLKQYKEGEKTAKRCLDLLEPGSYNWYYTLFHYFILTMHAKKLQKAFQIYKMAVEHPSYKSQYDPFSQTWRINEAFIYYFIYTGKIKPDKSSQLKKFRVSKFLNEVPLYSKDKRGANINILILQVLFLLHQKKYGKIIDRMEPLQTYTTRYLRKDHTFRSNCFIKMLLQLPAADFQKNGVIRRAKKHYDKLISVPLDIAKQSAELEIVPYEMLWETVLESLDTKFHKPRKKKNP